MFHKKIKNQLCETKRQLSLLWERYEILRIASYRNTETMNLLLNQLGLFVLHHPSEPGFVSLEKKQEDKTNVK